jgi:hypothetical protein
MWGSFLSRRELKPALLIEIGRALEPISGYQESTDRKKKLSYLFHGRAAVKSVITLSGHDVRSTLSFVLALGTGGPALR